jgi:hypothetical protein
MRRLASAKRLLVAGLATPILALGLYAGVTRGETGQQVGQRAAGSGEDCQMANVHPDAGTLTVSYVKDSSASDPDYRDYKLSGTIRMERRQGARPRPYVSFC